jgi:hypothetical protein
MEVVRFTPEEAVCASRGRWGGCEGGNGCLRILVYFLG